MTDERALTDKLSGLRAAMAVEDLAKRATAIEFALRQFRAADIIALGAPRSDLLDAMAIEIERPPEKLADFLPDFVAGYTTAVQVSAGRLRALKPRGGKHG